MQSAKVPPVLTRLARVMAILDSRLATAERSFQAEKRPKMAINRDFPGLRALLA